MDRKKFYGLITLLFVIISIVILTIVDKTNNINLSIAIQIIIILYLIRISYGCILYIKNNYKKWKYSYKLIMNLGLFLFLVINIIRQVILLFTEFNSTSISDIYINTLESFHFFAYITMPFILIISIFGAITNIILIKKEGFRSRNLLGVVFCILAIIAVFSGQIVYYIFEQVDFTTHQKYIKYFIDICLNATISYFYCNVLATLYCNYMAGRHEPEYNKDYVIILGCKIKKDGTLTPLLKARVDRALAFAKLQKEKRVKKENIIIENKSCNTKENMRFSKRKILEKGDGNIIFSTTNYHVFRSGVIANFEGIDCEGIGSKTKWYFYTNALIREFIANLFEQKWQHLFILITTYLTILNLMLIGYYNNLLVII